MPDIETIKGELYRYRRQVQRQRNEIVALQRAGLSTASAETLLQRMLVKMDALRDERDKALTDQTGRARVKILGGRRW
jgi:hypothetical protein